METLGSAKPPCAGSIPAPVSEMKRTAPIFIILSVLYLVLCTPTVHAQTFDAKKAYSDYQYELGIYQENYSDFQNTKTFYLSNPTLQLKEDARQKTLKMLKNRDNLMSIYLTAIRMQIVDSNGFNNDQKGTIFSKIDPEVSWYKSHMNNYLDTDQLVDLFNKSDESKSRYTTNTTPIIDESLFDVGLSQEIGLRMNHQEIYTNLKNYINSNVSEGKLKIDPFSLWFTDIDTTVQELQENEASGSAKIQSLETVNYGINSTYESANQILSSSVTLLSQLNNYLTNIISSIRNQI